MGILDKYILKYMFVFVSLLYFFYLKLPKSYTTSVNEEWLSLYLIET